MTHCPTRAALHRAQAALLDAQMSFGNLALWAALQARSLPSKPAKAEKGNVL